MTEKSEEQVASDKIATVLILSGSATLSAGVSLMYGVGAGLVAFGATIVFVGVSIIVSTHSK